ncbi:MAG: hypothetical protein ACR2P1_10485 [Pseudomonadales bacterium]
MELSFSEVKGMFSTAIDLTKKGSQMEAQAQIQKLQEQYLELHAQNLELKQELLELQARQKEQDQMIFDEPFFYIEGGETRDGPFCPRCWQGQDKKCRVIATPGSYDGTHQCQVCDECFGEGIPIPDMQVERY